MSAQFLTALRAEAWRILGDRHARASLRALARRFLLQHGAV